MKARITMAIAGAFAVPVLLLGIVTAQEAAPDATTQTETRQQAQGTTLQQRLDERKNRLKPTLDNPELAAIAQRCKPAQPLLKKLGDKVRANVPQRQRAYEEVDRRLVSLIEKLEVSGIDTATLKQQQGELNGKITAYKADAAKYHETLDDLTAMDCTADPVAFKASLDDARRLREDLSRQIADIRTYVMDTIKPALVEIRKSLAAGNTTEGGQ